MNDKYLWDMIDKLRDELNIAQDGITDLNDVVKDLQAEAIEQIKDNKRLNDKDGLYDEVKELQAELDKAEKGRQVMYNEMDAEVRELQAEIDNLKGENIDLINHADFIEQGKIKKVIDGFKAEIKELKNGSDVAYMEILHRSNDKLLAENKQLQNHVDKYGALRHDELQAEIDRLIKQVSSKRCNSSSTIQREIDDYMDHNPNCKGVRLFILPRDEFNDGEYDNTIYWDDGME